MWRIVVADGAEARMYESGAVPGRLTSLKVLVSPAARRHERELGTDAPGRTFNRASGSRQTLAPRESFRSREARRFAVAIAKDIERAVRDGECDDIVLVAAPRLLSLLRSSLPAPARRRILLEIPKDLVHQPASVLRAHLRGLGKRVS